VDPPEEGLVHLQFLPVPPGLQLLADCFGVLQVGGTHLQTRQVELPLLQTGAHLAAGVEDVADEAAPEAGVALGLGLLVEGERLDDAVADAEWGREYISLICSSFSGERTWKKSLLACTDRKLLRLLPESSADFL
jgi:hypothetical protein